MAFPLLHDNTVLFNLCRSRSYNTPRQLPEDNDSIPTYLANEQYVMGAWFSPVAVLQRPRCERTCVRRIHTNYRDCISATVVLEFDGFVGSADDFIRAVIWWTVVVAVFAWCRVSQARNPIMQP